MRCEYLTTVIGRNPQLILTASMSALQSFVEGCSLIAKNLCFLKLFSQRTFFISFPSVMFVNSHVCHEYDAALKDYD